MGRRQKAALVVLVASLAFMLVMFAVPIHAHLNVQGSGGVVRRVNFSCGSVVRHSAYSHDQAVRLLGGEIPVLGSQHAINDLCDHKHKRRIVYTSVVVAGGLVLALGLWLPRPRLLGIVLSGAGAFVVIVGLISYRNPG